jgi:hypothetical protein
MRRLLDIVLIALLLAAVGFGAYFIGHRVDSESNNLAASDSELHSTTVAVKPPATSKKHRTEIIVGASLGGVAVLIVLGSLGGAMRRTRKRDSWRAG